MILLPDDVAIGNKCLDNEIDYLISVLLQLTTIKNPKRSVLAAIA